MSTVSTTRVVHSAPVWLPQTQTWMYTQARSLPAWVENHVACETTQNLDQFDLPRIHALCKGSKLYHLWDKLVRGTGLRRYLGHLPRVLHRVGAHLLHSHFGHIGWTNLGSALISGMRSGGAGMRVSIPVFTIPMRPESSTTALVLMSE